METIPGYKIIEQLEDSRNAFTYRALRLASNDTVIIKVLKAKYPSPSEIAKFKQKCKIIRDVDIEGIIRIIDINDQTGSFVTILEDFDGISLKSYLGTRECDIKAFLTVAVQISETLGRLHKTNIIHKNGLIKNKQSIFCCSIVKCCSSHNLLF